MVHAVHVVHTMPLSDASTKAEKPINGRRIGVVPGRGSIKFFGHAARKWTAVAGAA